MKPSALLQPDEYFIVDVVSSYKGNKIPRKNILKEKNNRARQILTCL